MEDSGFLECVDDLYLYKIVYLPKFHKVDYGYESLLDLIIASEGKKIHELKTKPMLGNASQGHSL